MDEFWSEKAGGPKPAPKRIPPKTTPPKVIPVYVATRTLKYRFSDGTIIRLTDGVSPLDLTEAQTKELKASKRIREVK